MIPVNHGWLYLVGLGWVRLDHIWVEVVGYACLVGQTWGLGKISFGQVWDWVGLG